MADLVHFLRTFNGIVPLFWDWLFRPPIVCFVWMGLKKGEREMGVIGHFQHNLTGQLFNQSQSHTNTKSHGGPPHCCWPSLQSQENLLCLLDVWRISVWRNSREIMLLFCKNHYYSHGTLFQGERITHYIQAGPEKVKMQHKSERSFFYQN